MNRLVPVRLTDSQVVVDGVDLSRVTTAFRLTCSVNRNPVLELQLTAKPDVALDAEVLVSTPEDRRAVVADWLRAVDPAELERRVLDLLDWSPASNGELTLRVLLEMTDGPQT